MIAFPAGVKVWIAGGVTDMRCGMNSLALKVQQGLGRDPHGGEVFCFRGRKGDLIKVLWHDGIGMSLYLKRLEAGKFIWPVSQNGSAVPVSAAQLGYLLEGRDRGGTHGSEDHECLRLRTPPAGPQAVSRAPEPDGEGFGVTIGRRRLGAKSIRQLPCQPILSS